MAGGNDHTLTGAATTVSGSIANLVAFGADGYAVDANHDNAGFSFAVGAGAHDFGVTSHDQEVNYVTLSSVTDGPDGAAQTLTAWTNGGAGNGGHEVFTLTLDGDGTYTFTLINPLDQPAPGEDTTSLNLSSLIQATDFDGDVVALAADFKINVIDDVPVLTSASSSGLVDEGGLQQLENYYFYQSGTDLYGQGNDPHSPTVVSGSLANLVSFGADGAHTDTFSASFGDFHHQTTVTQTIADGFQLVGQSAAGSWVAGLAQTSHGQAINFATITSSTSTNGTTVTDTETLTAWTDGGPNGPDGGGHEVFTLALDVTTGAWTFTLLNPLDDAPGGAENSASLDLSGLVQAVDFDGDATTLSGDFTITVKDDVPVLAPFADASGSVDEGALHYSTTVGDLYGAGNDQGDGDHDQDDFATATASGSLWNLVSFGADGPAANAFQLVAQTQANAWLTSLNITSHGDKIDVATFSTDSHGNEVLTAGTDQGGGHAVFTLTLNESSGQWTFTLLNPIDQPSGQGENGKTIDLSGLVQAFDFDQDPVTLSGDFSVTVIDDVPVLTDVNASGAVDEGALTGSSHIGDLYGSGNDVGVGSASVVASGSLSGLVAFGADGPNASAQYQFVSQSAASHWLDGLNLASHGSDINSATIANEGGGVFLLTASAADGHEVFTLALNQASGAWTFTLINPIDDPFGHGENSQTIDLSGLVQGVDFDGDAVTLSNDFSVKVVDDVPVLVSGTSASGAVDEGGLTTHGGDLFSSGNDHGAAITASGSLSGLVSFGPGGAETRA